MIVKVNEGGGHISLQKSLFSNEFQNHLNLFPLTLDKILLMKVLQLQLSVAFLLVMNP